MGNIVYPNVNGVACSFASIEMGVDALAIPGIVSIDYKDNHEIGFAGGTSAHDTGWTRGKNRPTGQLSLLNAYWKSLLEMLGDGFFEKPNPIKVVYAEAASREDTMIDILPAVRIGSPERSHADGPDALVVGVQLFILGPIKWNGKVGLRASQV